MLNVIMLSVVMLNVGLLSVILQIVDAPNKYDLTSASLQKKLFLTEYITQPCLALPCLAWVKARAQTF
jgi:hypothetical protein